MRGSCTLPTTVVLLLYATLAAGCGSTPVAGTCIVELASPAYPPIAMTAHVTLRGIKARVHLRSGGVDQVELDYPEEQRAQGVLFAKAIEDAVARSRFDPACGSSTQVLQYDFVDDNPEHRDPLGRERVSFVLPNRIIVASTGVPATTSYGTR